MNKVLIMLCVLIAIGCSNQSHTEGVKETHEHQDQEELVLDNGSKWRLDENTRTNISEMKTILKKEASAEPDFTLIAEQVQNKTNELVQECKMSGPSHDMLHKWLEGFIDHQKLFDDKRTAKVEVYQHLQSDLEQFDRYFE